MGRDGDAEEKDAQLFTPGEWAGLEEAADLLLPLLVDGESLEEEEVEESIARLLDSASPVAGLGERLRAVQSPGF